MTNCPDGLNIYTTYITLHLHYFQNFICSIGIECVYDSGFPLQLLEFLRNFKAFSKVFTLFSKV